ncbi:CG14562 [Drosophila busckii]|uniref:CG14562 n=1 Tax=Drosophila busckii TaxID=30019 RepID=A0A0M5J1G7_DROBS|nr:CG14562 [Drosophila busckii]
MVKILQAYNFAKQQTYALNGDILAATLIGNNRIAISSAEQFIEIYDIAGKPKEELLEQQQQQEYATVHEEQSAGDTASPTPANDERLPNRYTLATVGEVVQLIYCEAGKYLLTLEKEQAGSPVHSNSTSISCTSSSNSNTVCSEDDTKMFVRIYANFWKFADAKLNELPITIRIASMTTPKTPLAESIDVIELPLRSPPELVQCCQTSGNIIVSSRDRIYLYEYTLCVHENTQPRFSFIDFLPFKFFVQLNFVPLRLCLAENVIACLSHRYCVAFKVVDALANKVAATGAAAQDISCLDNDYVVDEPLSESLSLGSKGSAAPVSSTHSQSCESDSLQSSSSGVNKPALANGAGLAGRTPLDFNVARLVNSANGREFEPELRSQWDQCEHGGSRCGIGGGEDNSLEITIAPQRAADIKIKLINEAKAMNVRGMAAGGSNSLEDASVQYDVRKLLQICMKSSEPQSRVLDILRCMDLKAIYQRCGEQLDEEDEYDMGNQQVPSAVTTFKHANRRTLKSAQHQRCVGHALLVASSVDGYLYQFCAQGKWYSENEKPVATYSFTAPVLQVHLNDYVVYAVTSESVETHTSRIGHKLFHNRFEYPSIGGLFPEESSPDVSAAIAVIGLAAFMHVQFVCVNREQLVLITNAALEQHKRRSTGEVAVVTVKRNIAARLIAEAKAKHSLLRSSSNSAPASVLNEWTLYSLEVPHVEHIVEDLEGIAESYRSASSCNFYDLMEEAHVMLRLSLTLQGERLSAEREQQLRQMFTLNCRKLADFSIRSSKQEVYLQATGFYKMCQLQLVEIYNNYIAQFMCGDQAADTTQLVGLIYTVKLFLLSLGTDRLKSSFLHQLVAPYFTPPRVLPPGYKQVPLSQEFLNMFIKHAPADIPQIMLSSPVVADAMGIELINYLKYLETLTPDEQLLLAVTACRMSNYLLAQETIAKCSRRALATALIKHKNVLFDDSTVLYQRRQQQAADHSQSQFPARKRQRQAKGKNKASTPTPNAIVSFSDFCETILLATEQAALIEAISDAFIHALCMEHSLTLDVVLQLFLNYIASHIGQKGYQSSQKVFINILQVYYYDLYDVSSSQQAAEVRSQTPPQLDDDYDEECSSSRAPSIHSEADVQSLSSSCASSAPDERSSISGRQQRIVYDQLQDQQGSPYQKRSSNASLSQLQPDDDQAATNLKGLKILFRMYMGRLKGLSDLITDLQPADVEQQSSREDFLNLRMECIAYMVGMAPNYCAKPSVRSVSDALNNKLIFVPYIPDYKLAEGEEFERHIKAYIRPIPCLLERPQYLNRLPPFERGDFSYPKKDEGEFEVRFTAWHNELLTLTLKIQSLLAASKIDREIISEFLAFIQKAPQLMGIDSFLVIILPKNLAINYMLSFCPAYLWQYGKSCGFTPKHWESLLRKILSKQETLKDWKAHVAEILNNLVAELSFEELLQCFPSEVIQNRNTAQYFAKEFADTCVLYEHEQLVFKTPEQPAGGRAHLPMDNIDEDNVFELTLRKAVAKQRSIALRSMIESTGTQLFDATSNPMYNL